MFAIGKDTPSRNARQKPQKIASAMVRLKAPWYLRKIWIQETNSPKRQDPNERTSSSQGWMVTAQFSC
ncbi:MAG: hypothetical protein NZM25_11580 [Leptospiraceae bacterium]|nr:hypothetical protein [Leptospiraceae bacterium]